MTHSTNLRAAHSGASTFKRPGDARSTTLTGAFLHMVYSPKGEHEGALLACDGAPVQLVFDRHDPDVAAAFARVAPGQRVDVAALPMAASPKGEGAHPVWACAGLLAVDGAPPAATEPASTLPAYRGRVVRLNYARHGAANGVVLDSGDFLHLKPDGMARLGLHIGDAVTADGDAQRLVDDAGWAVEVSVVNGVALRPH